MNGYQRFVAGREPVWDAFEQSLEKAGPKLRRVGYEDLEQLSFRYRQILHDHALAAQRFPETGAARRLRRLALEGTRRLAGENRGRRRGIGHFFAQRFPRAFRAQAGTTAVAVIIFLGAVALGLIAAAARPELGVAFVGEEARQGLAEGELWTEALGTTVPSSTASSEIATNNMSVAMTAWAGGALAGLLSLYILLLNGVMLGAVLSLTMHYAMAGQLFEFIAAHGPLELTLIVVSAAAGLTLGKALVAADDRPRGVALADAARSSLTVMLGCLPWLLVLGVVEGYISPAPGVPAVVKTAVGLSLQGIFLILAWNPWLKEADS